METFKKPPVFIVKEIRKRRLDNQWPSKAIAELLHITTDTYVGYETGKKQLTISRLKQISTLFSVSVPALLEPQRFGQYESEIPELKKRSAELDVSICNLRTKINTLYKETGNLIDK